MLHLPGAVLTHYNKGKGHTRLEVKPAAVGFGTR
jgi:hypothetical protein